MKSSFMLAIGIGIVIGISGSSAFFLVREATAERVIQGVMQMNSDGMVLLGHEAAQALLNENPESLRDFANYAVDSGIYQAKRGSTSGAYNDLLQAKVLTIPKERRGLSPSASLLMLSARQQIETMP